MCVLHRYVNLHTHTFKRFIFFLHLSSVECENAFEELFLANVRREKTIKVHLKTKNIHTDTHYNNDDKRTHTQIYTTKDIEKNQRNKNDIKFLAVAKLSSTKIKRY